MQEEFRKLAARLHVSEATRGMKDWLERADAKLRSGSWHRWQRHDPLPSITNALHVIEGSATLCSYRICYPRPSHEEFLRYLTHYYHGESNRQEDSFFPLAMKKAMLQGLGVPVHSILQPYVERIAHAANNIRVCDFFARPYFYLSRSYSEVSQMQEHIDFFVDMLPPAHIYTDNVRRVLRTGLARRLGDEYLGEDYVVSMVRMAAIVGLAERLFGIDDQGALYNEMSCPYKACPIYKTRLCHRYFAYPDDDFRKCKFPDILKALKLESLLESIPGYL